MTQEEKELLIKDLCGRLPYGVQYKDAHGYKKTIDIWSPEFHTALNTILYDEKPSLYLRPMSSMTEEEIDEFLDIVIPVEEGKGIVEEEKIDRYIHFCNSHYLDWRNLIPMGLALEAPEGMYNIKTE